MVTDFLNYLKNKDVINQSIKKDNDIKLIDKEFNRVKSLENPILSTDFKNLDNNYDLYISVIDKLVDCNINGSEGVDDDELYDYKFITKVHTLSYRYTRRLFDSHKKYIKHGYIDDDGFKLNFKKYDFNHYIDLENFLKFDDNIEVDSHTFFIIIYNFIIRVYFYFFNHKNHNINSVEFESINNIFILFFELLSHSNSISHFKDYDNNDIDTNNINYHLNNYDTDNVNDDLLHFYNHLKENRVVSNFFDIDEDFNLDFFFSSIESNFEILSNFINNHKTTINLDKDSFNKEYIEKVRERNNNIILDKDDKCLWGYKYKKTSLFMLERLENLMIVVRKSIFKKIHHIFSEPNIGCLKIHNMFIDLNIKDSKGNYLYLSPYFEHINNNNGGWYILSKDGYFSNRTIESKKDDFSEYLNHNVHIGLENDLLFISKSIVSIKETELFSEKVICTKDDFSIDNIFLGMDSNSKMIGRNILDDKHLLIVGSSGSGKSVLQNFLIKQLISSPITKLYLVDLKRGIEFSKYRKVDDCTVVSNIEQLAEILEGLIEIIDSRADEMVEQEILTYEGDKIYLVIDEYTQISYYDDCGIKENKQMISKLRNNLNVISTLGRAVGIRLICGLQKCTSAEMSTAFKNNLHDRVIMRSKNNLIYNEVFGSSDFGDDFIMPKASTLSPGMMLYLADGSEIPLVLKCPYEY